MKIGFVGAGGTGKSTTAKLLAQQLQLQVIKSPSRDCFRKHGVLTEDAQAALTPQQRLNLQMDIFDAIDYQSKQDTPGVYERTHLDNLFYALLHSPELLTKDKILWMQYTAIQGLLKFDLLFRFPLYNWQIPSDGMRTTLYAQRFMMDNYIIGFLTKHRIKYFTMQDEDVHLRVGFITSIASRYL